MRKILVLLAALALCIPSSAQKKPVQKRVRYEYHRNAPVYFEQLIADWKFPLAWQNAGIKKFDKWKQKARAKVFECMLTPPPPPTGGYDMQVEAEEQRDGYRALRITFQASRYYRIPALILIPDGKGPFPAVNVLHDHGAHLFIGKEKMVRPFADTEEVLTDAQQWVDNLYEGQYVGDYLARNGYVVISTDAPLWGERGRSEGVDRDKYDLIAGNMMMYGVDLCGYMHYDDITTTDFLASLPYVDANRIGCTGCSMGAYRSWMLSALSDRIKVGTAVCWMVSGDVQMSWRYGRSENGGFANCLPGMRQWMDYPHIASLACPKPMLFINGSQDKLFPVPGVEKAFSEMRTVWESQKATGNLVTEIWDIPHSCPLKAQVKVLEFFKKHL